MKATEVSGTNLAFQNLRIEKVSGPEILPISKKEVFEADCHTMINRG
jgi:hypothetical protein